MLFRAVGQGGDIRAGRRGVQVIFPVGVTTGPWPWERCLLRQPV
jgi:hypothetical protein